MSAWLTATLHRDPGADNAVTTVPPLSGRRLAAWADDDLQLALWCCYELHYRGFQDVDDEWEWHPAVTAVRTALERRWVAALRDLAGESTQVLPSDVPGTLRQLTRNADGPDLAGYLARKASRAQFAEFAVHRSVYQLKEADPHSFGIPRLDGPVKAALVEIQADEYGGGRAERMHAELFRTTMRWLDLNDSYGNYVPAVPAVTLAVSNLMSLFALHRRWIGALLGHLATLEMTSTEPNRLYSAGARRLGANTAARRYFDEHMQADAVHEQIAAHDLCGGYAAACPGSAADIIFGAACCLALDDILARHLLACWQAGEPSLLLPAGSRTAA